MSVISTLGSSSKRPEATGESFRFHWHTSAPRRLASQGGPAEAANWDAWREHLRRRRKPKSLVALLGSKRSPWQWATPPEQPSQQQLATDQRRTTDSPVDALTADRGAQLARAAASRRCDVPLLLAELPVWMAEMTVEPPTTSRAIEAIEWAHALVHLADRFTSTAWWDALGFLVEIARSAAPMPHDDPLAWQLLAGELPLTLAYLLPEVAECRQLAAAGHAQISAGFDELLADESMPCADCLPQLLGLLGCWTRARLIAQHLRRASVQWSATMRKQFGQSIMQAARLTGRHGSPAVSGAWRAERKDACELFTLAAQLSGSRTTQRVVAQLYQTPEPKPKTRKSKTPTRDKKLPLAGAHSEVSGLAVLWPAWSHKEPKLVVDFSGRQCLIQLTAQQLSATRSSTATPLDSLLISGATNPEVCLAGGEPLATESDWESICWTSDEDLDYLELEINLAQGVRVQRQLALARRDRLLYWADAVLCEQSTPIEYRLALPLAEEIRYVGADETCEGTLVGQEPLGRLFPLSLNEWRSANRGGQLVPEGRSLLLRQSSASAKALYVPMVLDLKASRWQSPVTWRELSVAEDRANVPADAAHGTRLRIGDAQWFTYRSLTGPGYSRTLLGHHLITEFLWARMGSEGKIETLVEIE